MNHLSLWLSRRVSLQYEDEIVATGILTGVAADWDPISGVWSWVTIDGRKYPLGEVHLADLFTPACEFCKDCVLTDDSMVCNADYVCPHLYEVVRNMNI